MGIRFMDRWRARHASPALDGGSFGTPGRVPAAGTDEPAMAELFSECELLRELAESAGVPLDDGVESLTALDQLLPRWRDDPEVSDGLGNDAGLYLGTVIHRTVPGTVWRLGDHGRPLVVLPNGLELDVTTVGHDWAVEGSPQLEVTYLAATDG